MSDFRGVSSGLALTARRMSDIKAPRPATSPTLALSCSRRAATSASSPRRSASEADAVVADLEDAVAPAEKPARARAGRRGVGGRAVVRVNGADTEWFARRPGARGGARARRDRAAEGDAGGRRGARPDGPAGDRDRRDGAGAAARLRDRLAAAGRRAHARRGRPRRRARARAARRTGSRSCYARSQVVVDSAAAGIRPPFDIVHLDDRATTPGSRQQCRLRALARLPRQGVHPPAAGPDRQPRRSRRASARSRGRGGWSTRSRRAARARCLAVNGEMVDLPVVERARRILAEAERSTA